MHAGPYMGWSDTSRRPPSASESQILSGRRKAFFLSLAMVSELRAEVGTLWMNSTKIPLVRVTSI